MSAGDQPSPNAREETPQEEAGSLEDVVSPDEIEKSWRQASGSEAPLLTHRERALLTDVLGLLSAIRTLDCQSGQPRIRDALLEVVTTLSQRLDEYDKEGQRSALTGRIDKLTNALLVAADFGLSAENCSLASKRSQLRSR